MESLHAGTSGAAIGGIDNARSSKPLTADAALDLVGNRCLRKFDRRAARRAQQRSLLLAYYSRDTGEIVTEMAMPIQVAERLWGNVRVGLAVKQPDGG